MRNHWLIRVRIVSWLALLFLLATCGGGGGPSPAGPPPTIVSGLDRLHRWHGISRKT